MKIYIGSDHAGFKLKAALMVELKKLGHTVVDNGAEKYALYDDYPDYIFPVARAVAQDFADGKTTEQVRGIVIGGSGQGEAIAANKVPGIRAAVYYGGGLLDSKMEIVKLSREHNDANVLSLGARFISKSQAVRAVKTWLATPFSNDARHIRRIKKIEWK